MGTEPVAGVVGFVVVEVQSELAMWNGSGNGVSMCLFYFANVDCYTFALTKYRQILAKKWIK